MSDYVRPEGHDGCFWCSCIERPHTYNTPWLNDLAAIGNEFLRKGHKPLVPSEAHLTKPQDGETPP